MTVTSTNLNTANNITRNAVNSATNKDNNISLPSNNKFKTNTENGKISASPSAHKDTSAQDSLTSLAGDFKNYMTLLTTQLKNQDPLDPLNTHEMTQQIATLTQVQQSVMTNKLLKEISQQTRAGQSASAAQLIGKEIEYSASELEFDGDSPLDFAFNIDSKDGQVVESAAVKILDEQNNVVFSKEMVASELTEGINNFRWLGKNDKGHASTEGTYRINVTAKDKIGNNIPIDTSNLTGVVKGALPMENGQTSLIVNNNPIQLKQIKMIKNSSSNSEKNNVITQSNNMSPPSNQPIGLEKVGDTALPLFNEASDKYKLSTNDQTHIIDHKA